jgi:outer membrane receptor protein involved in Fe transport
MSRTILNRRAASFAAVSLLALAAATPAFAQDEPAPATQDEQEVVVTATLRAQNLQDIPFSINAQTEEDIRRSGATNLETLSRNVAGLTIQNLGPGQSQVAVRGVAAGQVVRDQPGVKEQVGVYLDDSVISLSLFTPDVDLYDLNRVETLRGPQGTLFGSGSVGGTIRYITNQPNLTRMEGSIEANLNVLDGGDIGGALRGMINAPVTDGVAIRAVGYYTQYGGFIDAVGPAGGDAAHGDLALARPEILDGEAGDVARQALQIGGARALDVRLGLRIDREGNVLKVLRAQGRGHHDLLLVLGCGGRLILREGGRGGGEGQQRHGGKGGGAAVQKGPGHEGSCNGFLARTTC